MQNSWVINSSINCHRPSGRVKAFTHARTSLQMTLTSAKTQKKLALYGWKLTWHTKQLSVVTFRNSSGSEWELWNFSLYTFLLFEPLTMRIHLRLTYAVIFKKSMVWKTQERLGVSRLQYSRTIGDLHYHGRLVAWKVRNWKEIKGTWKKAENQGEEKKIQRSIALWQKSKTPSKPDFKKELFEIKSITKK